MLTLSELCVRYDNTEILSNINLSLQNSEILALLGPSGSGKSSILRFIAGLNQMPSGTLTLQNALLSKNGKHLVPAGKREIGMVFQDYSLFPHMDVEQNIKFGISALSKNIQIQKVKDLLALINLEGYEKKYPHELSGGQIHRISLARALASRPKILLLDEPFASLDKDIRQTLVINIRNILKSLEIAAIFVTHDTEDAHNFADIIYTIENNSLTTL